jgi:serine/threonine protein kinase
MTALPPPAVSQWAVSGCEARRVLPSNRLTVSPPASEAERIVGFGSFGIVWEVTNPRDGHRVALKRMTNVFDSVTSARRVVRELKMLFFLKHDNVRACPRDKHVRATSIVPFAVFAIQVLSALDIVSPMSFHFTEVYPCFTSLVLPAKFVRRCWWV